MGSVTVRIAGISLIWLCSAVPGLLATGSEKSGAVQVVAMDGDVETSTNGVAWRPLVQGESLPRGTFIRTGNQARCDLAVLDTGATFRLTPHSELQLNQVLSVPAGEMRVSDTRVVLTKGTVIGTQPKLASPSIFEVQTAGSISMMSATEYVVRADGAVSAIEGSVSVKYLEPSEGGPTQVTLLPGESFDPQTRSVVDTTPEFLENLIAEVDTLKRNAVNYRVGDAKVLVKPQKFMSPYKPGQNSSP
jgi:hypothetical protein